MDESLLDLDLNQQPQDPPVDSVLGLGSLFNEVGGSMIEQRIRNLEALTVRVRQPHSWPQAPNLTERHDVGIVVDVSDVGGIHNGDSTVNVNATRDIKRDGTYLVAKALAMDSDVNKIEKDPGYLFDCNICLYVAREPILTCCGHLYCWSCFYQLPYVDSAARECPVCKGEVTHKNVIPIYGNGKGTSETEIDHGLDIPPRPKAQRVESIRQQRVNRGASHVPVAEALRRIRTSIGTLGDQARRLDPSRVHLSSRTTSQDSRNAVIGSHNYSRLVSRVLSESAASLSSISSSLNNAERMVEDIETYLFQRSNANFLPDSDGNPPMRNASVVQIELRPLNATTDTASVPSSSRTIEPSVAVIRLENLATGASGVINLPISNSSSSSSGTSGFARVSDAEGELHESRRRRLN